MTKQERLLGQTILDFANAKVTDEACFEHFENIQNMMKFSPNFQERARKHFPFYAMPGPPPKPVKEEYDELSHEEVDLLKNLKDNSNPPFKLERTDSYEFLLDFSCTFWSKPPKIDPANAENAKPRTVYWRRYSSDPLAIRLGIARDLKTITHEIPRKRRDEKRDALTTPEGLLYIRRLSEEAEREGMTEGLEEHIEFRVDINDHERLAAIYDEQSAGDDIAKLKGLWERLNTIYVALEIVELRHQLKDLLQDIVSGRRYDDILGIETYASIYNDLPREKVIVKEFELGQITQENEEDYLSIRWPKEWITRFQKDIAYCLIGFLLPEGNINYLAKCLWCEKYFIRTKYNPAKLQKFCRYNGDGCKDDWHNRERVKSGKAAKYIKNGRAEGKYQ